MKALGKKGEIVNVSDGYARNAILPKKLGVEATTKNLNDLKLQNQHADKVAAENLEHAKELAEEIGTKKVVVKIKLININKAYIRTSHTSCIIVIITICLLKISSPYSELIFPAYSILSQALDCSLIFLCAACL